MSRVLSLAEGGVDGQCVVYVMARDQRVQDNPALKYAQDRAIEQDVPLVVWFNLLPQGNGRYKEHYEFMLDGLMQVEKDLSSHGISMRISQGSISDSLERMEMALKPSLVVFDMNPLRGPRKVQKDFAAKSEAEVCVVDARNVIPLWVLSDKLEFAAHTIRSKVHKNLADWLVQPQQIVKHPHDNGETYNDWEDIARFIKKMDSNGQKLGIKSGEAAAKEQLEQFIGRGLKSYAADRNNPNVYAQSGLSTYLHYGQISPIRVALEVIRSVGAEPLLLREGKLAKYEGEPTDIDGMDAFLEELIVRRELADNFCFYSDSYDSLGSAWDWAKETLEAHMSDVREYTYSLEDWEAATTHDQAWNAAQTEMARTGKMHGYMRMYWAKKILEWSESPKEAIRIAVYLNDKYSFDGRDPNGYTGIMWSIAGVHDRPWNEREVFGKIRYMNEGGLSRKFDLDAYIKANSQEQLF